MTPQEMRAIRDLLGLSQQEMADRYGYSSPSKISHYETGARPMPKMLSIVLDRDRRLRMLEIQLGELRDVTNATDGLTGWHRNGDVATWEEVGLSEQSVSGMIDLARV